MPQSEKGDIQSQDIKRFVKPTIPVLKAGHLGVLVIVCLRVCMGCIGSEFSSFMTNLASVLYTCTCTCTYNVYTGTCTQCKCVHALYTCSSSWHSKIHIVQQYLYLYTFYNTIISLCTLHVHVVCVHYLVQWLKYELNKTSLSINSWYFLRECTPASEQCTQLHFHMYTYMYMYSAHVHM